MPEEDVIFHEKAASGTVFHGKSRTKTEAMKNIRIITILGLLCIMAFGSCRKDYTCTCTTVVGPVSSTEAHQIDDVFYGDAKRTCNNYEDQANESLPGSTTCHL